MIRPQYHGRPTPEGFLIWDVRKLLELAKDLPVQQVPLETVQEFDDTYWYNSPDNVPTCRNVADHMKLVQAASLDYPILLCAEGKLMDGMHRVVKAHLEARTTISVRRLLHTPPPDFVDVPFEQLSYED